MIDFAHFIIALFWYAVVILLPGGAFSVLLHFLLSLPMHPFFELEVTPIIEHSTTQAWNAAHSAMPPF